jgi:hypothetical protein
VLKPVLGVNDRHPQIAWPQFPPTRWADVAVLHPVFYALEGSAMGEDSLLKQATAAAGRRQLSGGRAQGLSAHRAETPRLGAKR